MQLQDGNERLYGLGDLQERMGKPAGSKTDLSAGMVFSEKEKLKVKQILEELERTELQSYMRPVDLQWKIWWEMWSLSKGCVFWDHIL